MYWYVMSLYVKMAMTWLDCVCVSLLEHGMTCFMLMLIYVCIIY